jgi:hypothetical protein
LDTKSLKDLDEIEMSVNHAVGGITSRPWQFRHNFDRIARA